MNDWLENETKKIALEKNKRIRNTHEHWIFLAFVIFISLGFCFSNECHAKPHPKYLFPSTWICAVCGYENYDGINTCPVCGTRK